MAYAYGVRSNRAGVEERSSKHRSVCVECVVQLLSSHFARPAAIFDPPTFRRSEHLRMAFAQLACARAVTAGGVEPHREFARIEREGGGGHRAAPRPCTLASHAGET
jgi:hypothetical protein